MQESVPYKARSRSDERSETGEDDQFAREESRRSRSSSLSSQKTPRKGRSPSPKRLVVLKCRRDSH